MATISDVGLQPPAQTGHEQGLATWGDPNPPQGAGGGGETDQQRNARLQRELLNRYYATQPRTAPQSIAAQAAGASQASAQQAGSAGPATYNPYTSERAPGAQQASFSPFAAQTAGPAAQAEMTRLGQAALVRAPNINFTGADFVRVGQAQQAPDVRVGYTAGPGAGQAQQPAFMEGHWAAQPMDIQAARIGQLQQAQAGQVGQGDALRQRQMALLDYLQGSATGTNGPSAAEMQFQRNLDKSIAAQHAQAANARGTGRVSANLQAGYNIGEISQDANAQSAMLRAQEQQQARAQLLAGLSDTRGQDISVDTANANLRTAVSQFNAGQINAGQLQQAQLEQQTALANLQKQSSFSQFNSSQAQAQDLAMADLRARIEMSNAGMTTQAGIADSQIQAQRAQLQAQIDSQGGMFNAAQANEMQRLQAQMESTRGMFNAGQQNDISKAQAGMQLQGGMFNAGQQNSFRQQQAGLNSSERLFNAGAQNQQNQFNAGQFNAAGIANMGQAAETGRFNAGQTNQVNTFNTGQANQAAANNAQFGLQNQQWNLGQQNALNQFNTGQQNTVGTFNTGQTNQVNTYNAGLQNTANISNTDAMLRQQALDDARKNELMNQYLAASGQLQNANQFNAQTNLERQKLKWGTIGNSLAAGSGIVGTLVSDKRAKTDVKPMYSDERGKTDKQKLLASYDQGGGAGGDDVGKLLDNLKAYKFRYKDPSEPGTAPGERYGIMAQDLEKSPMGASIVVNDGGRKKIDPSQAVGVILAAMSRMNSRIKKAEKR